MPLVVKLKSLKSIQVYALITWWPNNKIKLKKPTNKNMNE